MLEHVVVSYFLFIFVFYIFKLNTVLQIKCMYI